MKSILSILFLSISFASFGQKVVSVSTTPAGSYSSTLSLIGTKQDSLNFYQPEKYGAVGDGVTNDATAFTNMIAAMPVGSTVNLQSNKTYILNTTIVINKSVKFTGSGTSTIIKSGTNDMVLFKVVEANVIFRDMWLRSTQFTPSSGCAIRIDTNVRTGGAVAKFTIDNVFFTGFYNCIESLNAHSFSITNCNINFINYGVQVACASTPDAGDSHISGCIFNPMVGFTGNSAIYQTNSGGLRIVNNKFNYNSVQRYSYAYNASLTETSDLIISANSFENYTVNAIKILAPSRFVNIAITGNQFSALNSSAGANIVVDNLDNLAIMGNVFTRNTGASDTAIVLTNCTNINIANTYLTYGTYVKYYGTNSHINGDGAGNNTPKLTATEASALSSPTDGKLIYVSSTNGTFTSVGFWGREGGAWVKK